MHGDRRTDTLMLIHTLYKIIRCTRQIYVTKEIGATARGILSPLGSVPQGMLKANAQRHARILSRTHDVTGILRMHVRVCRYSFRVNRHDVCSRSLCLRVVDYRPG